MNWSKNVHWNNLRQTHCDNSLVLIRTRPTKSCFLFLRKRESNSSLWTMILLVDSIASSPSTALCRFHLVVRSADGTNLRRGGDGLLHGAVLHQSNQALCALLNGSLSQNCPRLAVQGHATMLDRVEIMNQVPVGGG